jgi:hypothetical protein
MLRKSHIGLLTGRLGYIKSHQYIGDCDTKCKTPQVHRFTEDIAQ